MKLSKRTFPRAAGALAAAALMAISTGLPAAAEARQKIRSVAVFVPGAVAGSPLYEQMVAGAQRACKEAGVKFSAVEAGFNQADWSGKLSQLAASGEWDLIVSSNPAIPALCLEALKIAPDQKFLVADAYLGGNANLATVQYNQVEQGYLLGYFAGLVSLEKGDGKNKAKKVGVVLAQDYPSLDQAILPGFEKGLSDAAPGYGIESRLIGNWYDSSKAMELSKGLLDSGVTVLFPVAGGAGQGVLSAAKEAGKYVVWFDGTAYAQAPGTILACSIIRQEKLMYEKVQAALSGKLAWGKAEVLSVKDGYVDFDDSDPLYRKYASASVQAKMKVVVDGMRSGKISFKTPTF